MHGLESTIIGLQNERVVIYRHGGVTSEMLAAQLGYVPDVKTQEESGVLTSGMVKHHYATDTPLFLGYKPATASETSLQITIGPKEHISGPLIILSQTTHLRRLRAICMLACTKPMPQMQQLFTSSLSPMKALAKP